jgi:hypothetical protein
MHILVYAQRNLILCGFLKKRRCDTQKKETEPSQSFAGNTKEEKNSHCIRVCALRWKKSQPNTFMPRF